MYIIKNAVKNLGRNKGRNILMAVIIFAIILTTAISIIINTTTDAIIEDYKGRFGAEVSLNVDYNAVWQMNDPDNDFQKLSAQQQIEFSKSELLQSAVMHATGLAVPQGITMLDETAQNTGPMQEWGQEESDTLFPTAKIIGSQNAEINDEFASGVRKISEGRMYKEEHECIISKQLAAKNSLSVGDTIEINSTSISKPYTTVLTITGTYEDNTDFESSGNYFTYAFLNRHNEILCSFETLTSLELFGQNGELDAKYYLAAPDDFEAFEKELKDKGLPDYYTASVDEEAYKQIVGPVEGLAKTSATFMIVVLLLGSAVLILLSTLAIRERKYEIGVLRAMGMKKGKIALGLVCEMVILTILCLILGLGAASAASQPVADSLLANQIEIAEQSEDISGEVGSAGGWINDTEREPLSELNVSLNFNAVTQITLISLLLAALSSVIGILYVTRYEPMKILSERN